MRKVIEMLYKIFGWGFYMCLFAGGLAFFGFLVAIIMGGPKATQLAVFIKSQYFPVVIRITTITIGIGLIGMYLNKELALSLVTDKKEAEKEILKTKEEQVKG
jgi:hypothetical protein